MIDLNRYKKHDGNEATNAEGLEANKENMTRYEIEQFKQLLLTELKQWKNGNSSEAKYRVEMLKELIEKINEN